MFRIYADALRGFRRRAALTVALFVLSGLAESVGIAALLPFLQGAVEATNDGDGAFGEQSWLGLEGRGLAAAALVVLVVLGLTAAGLRYLAETRAFRLQTALDESLRTRITEALLEMRWTAYLRLSLGDTTKAVLYEGAEVGRGVHGLVLGIGSALIAGAFVIVAAAVSLPITAAILLFGGLTAVVYRAAARRAERTGESLSTQGMHLTEMVTELFGSAKFFRSSGQSGYALGRASRMYAQWRDDNYRVLRYQPISRVSFDAGGVVFIAALLAFSIFVAEASAAEVIVLVALFYRLSPKIQLVQQGLLTARAQVPWWLSWKARLLTAQQEAEKRGGSVILEKIPRITADDVGFTFPGREIPALTSASWELRPGECLAIVGESGSGKTTMLDVVTGLLKPTAGSIRLDGIELEDVDRTSWQHRIGLVIQDAPLFYGSIVENIAWNEPSPDRAKVMRCAEMANIADVIASLPAGLDTSVGHRGGQLSGGQRQRIALARALYREPWLLILDEATSSLDAHSEQAIHESLRALKGMCSILLVAHRLKTVSIADEILVLVEGRIAEHGSWSQLMDREGAFRSMARLQGISESRARSR